MCGVFGLVWLEQHVEGGAERARAAANAMLECLRHRGPDGAGIHDAPGVLLGHRRLAIVDLEGGAQPMTGSGGKVALSFNGEVYNFPELMGDMAARGWNFDSRCDTETLLAGYCLDGERFDEQLNGMYAYAIFDERGGERKIQLSTDPIGIKPMFIYEGDGLVLFASELQAIIAGLRKFGRAHAIDRRALGAYLRLGWVPAPLTLVTGVRKLLPGERWQIDCASASVSLASTRATPSSPPHQGGADAFDALLGRELEQAMSRQLISDVPVGFFLSGGIDSSLLLAVARELGHTATSFTIRFAGQGHGVAAANEAEIARAVADRLGVTLHTIDVDSAAMRETLEGALSAMDQPLADPACLPLLLLARFARERVKVCISGDGGDELFAGYPRHALAAVRDRWGRLPGPLRSLCGGVARCLPEAPSAGFREILRKSRVAYGMVAADQYVAGPFSAEVASDPELEPWNYAITADARSLMSADLKGQLAGQMLPKTDNMTMAASLECRVPLLDLQLVGLAAEAPLEWKRVGRLGKLPLRRQLARYLPSDITDRPKQGFRVPLTSWFRGPLSEEISDRLLSREADLADILGAGTIRRVLDEHIAGRAEHSIRIWALLALDNWLSRFEQA